METVPSKENEEMQRTPMSTVLGLDIGTVHLGYARIGFSIRIEDDCGLCDLVLLDLGTKDLIKDSKSISPYTTPLPFNAEIVKFLKTVCGDTKPAATVIEQFYYNTWKMHQNPGSIKTAVEMIVTQTMFFANAHGMGYSPKFVSSSAVKKALEIEEGHRSNKKEVLQRARTEFGNWDIKDDHQADAIYLIIFWIKQWFNENKPGLLIKFASLGHQVKSERVNKD